MVNQQSNPFLINKMTINGNNEGSIQSNKTYHICYATLSNDLNNRTKKIFGCFINPYDRYLDPSVDLEDLFYYFQVILPIEKQFNIQELLKNTIYSKKYSNHIMKEFLQENRDNKVVMMLKICEEKLTELCKTS